MYACIHGAGIDSAFLHDCAARFSPRIDVGPEHVIIDLRGMETLFGGPETVARRISGDAGPDVNVAVAATPHAAAVAARGFPGITIIAPGDEARALARLPVALLSPSDDMQETFAAWGIGTFGDLSRLPECGIADRLGEEGLKLHRLARGLDPAPINAATEAADFSASVELEHALGSLEPLSFLVSRLLHDICGRLNSLSLAANEIRVDLDLEDRSTFTRALRLPFASRDAGTFLRLIQYDLAAHPPAAAIMHVKLTATPVDPRTVQHGLFIPAAPQPERLELTLARVAAIVGEGNVGSPEMLDTHRPGAYRMTRFHASEGDPLGGEPAAPRLALRRFRPPLPAIVTATAGRPIRVRAKGVAGTITRSAGPWRTSGDWWTQSPWSRDEWDIELESGALYRIYHEGASGWFIEGNYD
jgi:protein ImuB